MKKQQFKRLTIFFTIFTLLVVISGNAFSEEATTQPFDANYFKAMMEMVKGKYNGNLTDSKLIEGALKGMFKSADNYTEFFNKEEAEGFLGTVHGNFGGVGVMIEKIDNYVVVTKVFPGTPAESAGVFPGDRITQINNENAVDMAVDAVASKIRGEVGTTVKITLLREGVQSLINLELKRATIEVSPVTYDIQNDVMVLKLEIFNSNATENLVKALNEAKSKGVTKLVFDLRNNPGGELGQAVNVARQFVPKGLITKVEFKDPELKNEDFYSEGKAYDFKIAVLVNGQSASASEIVTGAMQDTAAGTIIGSKTFGKAKVQNLYPILTPEAFSKYKAQISKELVIGSDLSQFGITPTDDEILGWSKITVGFYYTPKGRMIDLVGITPDVVVDDPKPINDIDINNVLRCRKITKFKIASQGIDVYNAEKILKAAGYGISSADTVLDEATFAEIAKFQKASGLFPYGVLDFATQQALNDKLESLKLANDAQYAKAIQVLNQK